VTIEPAISVMCRFPST